MSADIYAALGMKANPFPPGACKEPYYFTESAKRILDELHYGVAARKGFLLVIGEVGLGKTSLLLQFLPLLEKGELEVSWVFNTVLDKVELLGAVAKDFGLRIPRAANLTEIIDHLHQFFLKQAQNNKNCAIVIDEAHHLDNDTLELLRMLSNLELEGDKLVQILLVGQPELMTRLWSQELRQLRSRINIFIELPPLSKDETGNYVNFKLSTAGSQLRLDGKALGLVWTASKGNFRMINLIMEKTLHAVIAYNADRISPLLVNEALKEIAPVHIDVARELNRARMKNALFNVLTVVGAVLIAGGLLTAIYPNEMTSFLKSIFSSG